MRVRKWAGAGRTGYPYAAVEPLADQLHQPLYTWRVAIRRMAQVLLAGRLPEAERLALAAADMGERGGVARLSVQVVLGYQLCCLRYDQGRLAEIEDMVAGLIESAPGLPVFRALLALLYCETERPALARPQLEALTGGGVEISRSDRTWFVLAIALALAAAAVADPKPCELAYRQLAPYPGRTGRGAGPAVFGVVDLGLAVLAAALGRFDEADAHFVAAEQLCRRMPAPTWLARTRLEWARILTGRARPGDAERARQLAGHTLTAAEELGMARVADQARGLLVGN